MKKLVGAAIAAGATVAGAGIANAEISANVALTSDYVFRGVSLSESDPAIQGGFDWSSDQFYAGVWASSLPEGMEIDVYAGFTPTLGAFEFDLGAIGYFYPSADDEDAEFDYYELLAAVEVPVSERFSVGGGVYFSPENYGETGEATYFEINGTFAASDALEFTAAYGNQSIEDADGEDGVDVTDESDYNTWNIGGTYALHGFALDLRYHDTDIDEGSDIEYYTYGPDSYDERVVFTISREL
ncbi:MAG: TorF family putative porin [Hyphomonadaceae bacterium]|nr:TorF family putative porin [Hyphomonadaceae bacterium]